MKRGKVTALVMAFIMAVSVLASPVTMLNTNAAVKAKKITMAKKATLEVGAKKKLKVTVKPAKAKVKITFRTSNSRIAKVNSKGVVKGVKAGQATITAKAKVGKKVLKAKQKITVKKKAKQTPAAIKITSLTVKKYDVTINEGNIETMAVTVLPANATNKKLQYTTSDNNVATVDNKGVITAIAQGSCKVTAETMDGSNRSVSVNVTVTKTQRPRCIITQDAEVDDMNSLIHVLLYSNEVDIQGIVQSSSKFHWKGVAGQKEEKYTKPYRWPGTEWMQKYLNAYQKVYPNLKKHDKSYPAPAYLKSVTKVGNIGYKGEMDSATEGSELIKKTILDNDERTLYLLAWGGTNTISRALKDIEKEYKGTKQWDAIRKKIINKVVIPACGEQDETYSEYIAEEWPEIKNPKKYAGQRVVIGSVTDGYNPQEEQFGNTRKLLEQLIGSDADILICTKSDLVVRDIDLLKKLGRVTVSWSINTLDENFKNDMDSASSIERRIAAMKQVYDAGIRTVCFVSPVFPGITDFEAIFERVKDQCDLFWLENLNLRDGFKKTIMDYIAGKYPDLVPLYDEIYNKHNRSYFEALEAKAEEMAKKYDCPFVDNEMPYGRVPQGHPVLVDYFYHEEIRGTENTGKRNR